ncbi:MAG: NAD+ synthase [Candidatus Omnitrophica bacterium]|nr:NAD+ synthase [Candidatus Omnitrophota bacterium]
MRKKIRFAIAQMNPTVGDFPGNVRKIMAWITQANKKKADLIVFPELALSGYPVWDLANKKSFIDEGLKRLKAIAQSTKNKQIAVALGFVGKGIRGMGRSTNAMAWIEKGNVRAVQVKRLLPTYDVFLEEIFFEAGKVSQVINSKGVKVGPTICEDLWDDFYSEKPVDDLVKKGIDLLVNVSASPYFRGVSERRDLLMKRHAVRHSIPILYVNQVGGQDDLIFDGRSLFVDEKGKILFRAPAFREGLFYYDWERMQSSEIDSSVYSDSNSPQEIYQALVLGIQDYCRKNKFKKVLIGLSGGIDSAMVATLAVDALGARNVLGITMPGSYSSKGSWSDSRELASRLGIEFRVRPIKKNYELMIKQYRGYAAQKGGKGFKKVTPAMENLQARLRGLDLMYISNDEGRLLLSTGNKSELAMGYCTLYGDMAGGLCVLGDVYKTDVYRLAWYRNEKKEVIPVNILTKAPSAELRPNQKDQDSLPPYDVLDEILFLYIEKNLSRTEIMDNLESRNFNRQIVDDVINRVDHNEYKRRQTPPILRVTEKAWFGRRMPITNRFR